MRTRSARRLLPLTAALLMMSGAALAQDRPATPSFSVSTSHVYNTHERPSISLVYQRVDHLDFRVYKVSDAFAFFERLRDPHQLGSEEPVVPQERTWLERIATWKSDRRSDVRRFFRGQLSPEYRRARNSQRDTQEVVMRQTLNVNSFAQVPLLNASQLVTSWRELLPPLKDPEYRHIPLDVSAPGIYVVEAVSAPLRAYTVVVVSDVGLVTKTAPGRLLVYAANRFTGDPMAGCRVRVISNQQIVANGGTAADGTFESSVAVTEPDNLITVADCAGQTAATDPGAYTVHETARSLVGYTYTDRPVYRPGHVVHYKSVLRWRERGALLPFGVNAVEVSILDDGGKVLTRERKSVDTFGSLHGSFTIPVTASLGYYSVRIASGDATASGSFEVQEYRKPEFDVAVRPGARFVLQGGNATATIAARYYFGQPVAGGHVTYVLHKQPYYSPLRSDVGDEDAGYGGDYGGGAEAFQGEATLNDQGTVDVSVPLEVDGEGRDFTARIEARVIDASGREVSGAASLTATFGRFMLIARTERYVLAPGDLAGINIRAVSHDGTPQPNLRVRGVVERVDYRGSGDSPRLTTMAQGEVTTDADGRARWTPTAPQQPGSYRVRIIAPSEGRQVSDTTYIWVPGRREAEENEVDQFLELVADRRTYQPGDTASLVIQGAEFDTSVLVTKESQHVSFHQVVHAKGNEAITVPITDDDVGDSYVSIAFLKDDRLYRAERRLSVPAVTRQLAITATADRPVVRPGEPGVFTLHVADASGAPVRAQLSVGLVDEALYGVRPDSTPDPLRFFYRREYNMVSTSFSRDYPFVGYSGTEQLLLARRHRPMTLADFKADRPDRPRVRKDFPDTVFWQAEVTTNTEGNAQVTVDYPDSLTTWRLTVRGVTSTTHVGTTTANTTTTKDMILRVVTPRFLTEGDQVTLPAIVHNYLPTAKTVNVALAADGLTSTATAGAPAARSMQVAPNGQQRADWTFRANDVRTVSVTGKVTSDAASDAMAMSLPVLPAGLQRNSGASGSIVDATPRSVDLTVPPTANANGRSVRISLAPSLAGTMLGALDYLTSFPWGCTEQTLSSFIPNLVVLRAMVDLKIAPTERLQSIDRQVGDGLKRLYGFQHDDGGWGWWKTDANHPFMTAYAIEGLLQAKENGVTIEGYRIITASNALRAMYGQYPRAIPDLKAYVVYALLRAESEETDTFTFAAAIDDLWQARSRMTASGQSYLLMTLDRRKDARGDTLARELLASAHTEGEVSSWPADSDPLLDDFGDTSVEASALALRALSTREPHNPTLERVARWLVLSRTSGYWVSTKQTAIALQGLLAYMKARGERPSPVTADIFVNDVKIKTQSFDARALTSPNPVLIEAPAREGVNNIRITKQGDGTIYFDAAVRYYDKPAAAERTGTRRLALTRRYFTLTPVSRNGRIVYREAPFKGTARAGDVILVRLTAAGSKDWKYLMLEDPIPAGTEQIEKESGYEIERLTTDWFYGSQRELRDDRTVYFLSDFSAGRYEFSYLLKVTTPGVFSAMPARLSPMYVPSVSASSDVATVTVTAEGFR
ncbi:MAG: MG2 domain-containing protein [Vicinamibacterales bacterium]